MFGHTSASVYYTEYKPKNSNNNNNIHVFSATLNMGCRPQIESYVSNPCFIVKYLDPVFLGLGGGGGQGGMQPTKALVWEQDYILHHISTTTN